MAENLTATQSRCNELSREASRLRGLLEEKEILIRRLQAALSLGMPVSLIGPELEPTDDLPIPLRPIRKAGLPPAGGT